jgi:hypothetical protein
MIMN